MGSFCGILQLGMQYMLPHQLSMIQFLLVVTMLKTDLVGSPILSGNEVYSSPALAADGSIFFGKGDNDDGSYEGMGNVYQGNWGRYSSRKVTSSHFGGKIALAPHFWHRRYVDI